MTLDSATANIDGTQYEITLDSVEPTDDGTTDITVSAQRFGNTAIVEDAQLEISVDGVSLYSKATTTGRTTAPSSETHTLAAVSGSDITLRWVPEYDPDAAVELSHSYDGVDLRIGDCSAPDTAATGRDATLSATVENNTSRRQYAVAIWTFSGRDMITSPPTPIQADGSGEIDQNVTFEERGSYDVSVGIM